MLQVSIESITPAEYKNIIPSLTINYGFHSVIFGNCLIGLVDKKICYLAFTDDANLSLNDIKTEWKGASLIEEQLKTKDIIKYIFEDYNISKELPLLLKGTPFQIEVWKTLMQIPFGGKVSYEDIACKIGNSKAVRAVANYIAKNNVSYLIPCHRVIKKSGAIHKYRWGSERKAAILKWEASFKNSVPYSS